MPPPPHAAPMPPPAAKRAVYKPLATPPKPTHPPTHTQPPPPHTRAGRSAQLISALVVYEMNSLVDEMDYEELLAVFGGEFGGRVLWPVWGLVSCWRCLEASFGVEFSGRVGRRVGLAQVGGEPGVLLLAVLACVALLLMALRVLCRPHAARRTKAAGLKAPPLPCSLMAARRSSRSLAQGHLSACHRLLPQGLRRAGAAAPSCAVPGLTHHSCLPT